MSISIDGGGDRVDRHHAAFGRAGGGDRVEPGKVAVEAESDELAAHARQDVVEADQPAFLGGEHCGVDRHLADRSAGQVEREGDRAQIERRVAQLGRERLFPDRQPIGCGRPREFDPEAQPPGEGRVEIVGVGWWSARRGR
ncbi:MAG: hypothetical protein WDN24_20160 [Sphingomonas sp.]